MESLERNNLNSWENLQKSLETFTNLLTSALDIAGIRKEAEQLPIDHICIRLDTPVKVDALKKELEDKGEIISSVDVNGREISMIQLHTPLKIGKWSVSAIELPYPKENHNYSNGWEHVEFVLPEAENTMGGVKESFSTLSQALQKNN